LGRRWLPIKPRFHPYDTDGMSVIFKSILAQSSSSAGSLTFVVLVLAGSLVFAWIVGIAEIAGKPENEFATGTRTTWLLLVIFTGVIGLVAYVLVGKRRGNSNALVGTHSVRWDGQRLGRWVCADCSFTTPHEAVARAHHLEAGAVPVTSAMTNPTAVPTPLPSVTPSPPVTAPEFKTCPDCAEEVRAAARKCRFCGHMFEDVPTDA